VGSRNIITRIKKQPVNTRMFFAKVSFLFFFNDVLRFLKSCQRAHVVHNNILQFIIFRISF
jgi:hypothetical protein